MSETGVRSPCLRGRGAAHNTIARYYGSEFLGGSWRDATSWVIMAPASIC